VFARQRQQSLRREPAGMTRQAALLLVGTVLLLLVSGGIVLWGSRGATSPPPPPTTTNIAAGAASTALPATPPTAAPPTATATPPATATGRAAATVASTARPASATVTRAASATPTRPLVANGLCVLGLPSGFTEERPGGGYYPALDKTGFVALDQFSTEGGTRTPDELATRFTTATLALTLQDVRQTGAESVEGGYRVDFTASVGGQPGRGSVFVRASGSAACGATVYLLDRSPLPFATTREGVILSVGTK
jgi:hypothetical protein